MVQANQPSVVLAYDPLDRTHLPKSSLQGFSKKYSLSLHSLSVVKTPGLPKPKDFSIWETKIQRILKPYGVGNIRVLLTMAGSRETTVDAFLGALRASAVDCVLLSSHARAGLSRWVFGSFAESLLWKSPVPLIFFPKVWKSNAAKRRVLFATDFSEESLDQLEHFLAKFSVDQVVIFHSIHLPIPYTAMESPPQFSQDFFAQQESRAKAIFSKWQQRSSFQSVELSFVLHSSKLGFLTGMEILAAGKKVKVDMIVLSAKTDFLQRILFGSAAFELFRKKSLPIFVFGPKFVFNPRRS